MTNALRRVRRASLWVTAAIAMSALAHGQDYGSERAIDEHLSRWEIAPVLEHP